MSETKTESNVFENIYVIPEELRDTNCITSKDEHYLEITGGKKKEKQKKEEHKREEHRPKEDKRESKKSSENKFDALAKSLGGEFVKKVHLMNRADLIKEIGASIVKNFQNLSESEFNDLINKTLEEINYQGKINHPILKISKDLQKSEEFKKVIEKMKNYSVLRDKCINQSLRYNGFSEVLNTRLNDYMNLGKPGSPSVHPVIFSLFSDKISPLEEMVVIDDTLAMYQDLTKSVGSTTFNQTSLGKIYNAKSTMRNKPSIKKEIENIKLHALLKLFILSVRSFDFTTDKTNSTEFDNIIGGDDSPANVYRSIVEMVGLEPLMCTRDGKNPFTAKSLHIKSSDFNFINFNNDYVLHDSGGIFKILPEGGEITPKKNDSVSFAKDLYSSFYVSTPGFNNTITKEIPHVLDCNGILVIETDRTAQKDLLNPFPGYVSFDYNIVNNELTSIVENLVTKTINGKEFNLSTAICWRTNTPGTINSSSNYADGCIALKKIVYGGEQSWFCYDQKNIIKLKKEIYDEYDEDGPGDDDLDMSPELKRLYTIITKTNEVNNIIQMKKCIIPFDDGINYIQKHSAMLIYVQ